MSRSRFLTIISLACLTCCAMSGFTPSQQPTPEKKDSNEEILLTFDQFVANAIKPDPKDSPLRKLQKERCRDRAVALAKFEQSIAVCRWDTQNGLGLEPLKLPITLSKNLLELMDEPADQLMCYELQVNLLNKVEKDLVTRVLVGADPSQYLNIIKAVRIDAEIELIKFKTQMKDTEENILHKLDPFIANAIKPDPNDTHLRKLQKERCRERAIALAKFKELIEIGKWNPTDFNEVLKIPVTLSENLLELMDKPIDQLKCYVFRVEFLKYVEKFMDTRVAVGSDPSQNRDIAKAARIDAEIALFKFKPTMEPPKK